MSEAIDRRGARELPRRVIYVRARISVLEIDFAIVGTKLQVNRLATPILLLSAREDGGMASSRELVKAAT